MFIKNLNSGVIQECRNNDVINHCKRNPKEYQVAESAETLMEGAQDTENTAQNEPEEAQSDADEENINEGTENDYKGKSEGVEVDYTSMKVEELRKVAKEKGIQGYGNMNKETLIEVIKAHE